MKILTIVLSAAGLTAFLACAVYALTHRAALVSKTTPDGAAVMRKGTKNFLAAGYALVFGAAACAYALTRALSAGETAPQLGATGLVFILLGTFFLWYAAMERIEYDDREIRMYRLFQKAPQRIGWAGVESLTVHRIGPMMEISGGGEKIFVEFRNPGMVPLLTHMALRLTGENRALVRELLGSLARKSE